MFWSNKNSGEVLNKLKSRGFRATSLSTYDFSTLYTTLPHNLIKEKLINLIEWTFKREGSPYIACNERQAFFTSEDTKRYKLWSCQNVCEALIYLLDNIYIRFGTNLCRQIVGIPMGTNCAPLVADLFLFCYERDFMTSLSDVKQAEIIEAFKSTSRYLDDLLNIDNPYFEACSKYGDLTSSVHTVNNFQCFVINKRMHVFVFGDHMLDWISYQLCYPLEIKLLLSLLLLLLCVGCQWSLLAVHHYEQWEVTTHCYRTVAKQKHN